MATRRNKTGIVSSPEVTKSDFTIGFCVVDLVKKHDLVVILLVNERVPDRKRLILP